MKSAEGRESGHSPKARRELPQVSCACSEETCFSRRACISWRETETHGVRSPRHRASGVTAAFQVNSQDTFLNTQHDKISPFLLRGKFQGIFHHIYAIFQKSAWTPDLCSSITAGELSKAVKVAAGRAPPTSCSAVLQEAVSDTSQYLLVCWGSLGADICFPARCRKRAV